MNSSVTRTLLFEFWKNTDEYAGPVNDPSYPPSMSAQAFFSSSTLQLMNSTMSGWSAFRMTIFAARRVLPPDLITPANASYPFMKETGPLAVPPPARCSLADRIVDRLLPVPEPNLNSIRSVFASVRLGAVVTSRELMEHGGALVAADYGRADFPIDLAERIHTRQREIARQLEPGHRRPFYFRTLPRAGRRVESSTLSLHLLTGCGSFAGRASFHGLLHRT